MATDPENRGPQIFAVNVFFSVAAVVIVLLRIYTRAVIVKAFGMDDWLIILSTVRAERTQINPYMQRHFTNNVPHRYSASFLL